MNKYQKALNKAKYDCDNMYQNELGNINKYSQDTDYFDTLQELINKWTELGCELSNLPFLDDECKLKTIKFIERIYYGK